MMIVGVGRIVNFVEELVQFGRISQGQSDRQFEPVRALQTLEWRQLLYRIRDMIMQYLSLGSFRERNYQQKENDDPVQTHLSHQIQNSHFSYHTPEEIASKRGDWIQVVLFLPRAPVPKRSKVCLPGV